MATPQKENGYTPVANEIVDALCRANLSAHESRVLWVIFRMTYGWQRKSDRISLSQFVLKTELNKRDVHRTIKRLVGKNIIKTYKDDGIHLSYEFQKDYDKWNRKERGKKVCLNDDQKVGLNDDSFVGETVPPKKQKKEKSDNIPYQKILDSWATHLPGLVHPRKVSDKLKVSIGARWKEDKERQDIGWWDDFFEYMSKSQFLTGNNDRGWRPSIYWVVENDDRILKIEAGTYR